MMCAVIQLLLFLSACVLSNANSTHVITVGAVLSSKEYGQVFEDAIKRVNGEPASLPDGVKLNSTWIQMDDNPIRAAKSICDSLIPSQVYVVIASHSPNSDLSPMAVSFTCGFYKIPVIGIAARNSAFSDKNVHSSFMRTVSPYSDQADVWIDIVKHFKWKQVLFMHSSDEEGRAMLGRFQSRLDAKGIQMEKNIQYTAGQKKFTQELMSIKNELIQSRVILLYAIREDAENIFRSANALNLTGAGFVWIVTEQALDVSNTPLGILGLRMVDHDNEAAHIKDSVRIIAQAINQMYPKENISEAPTQCGQGPDVFPSGPQILSYLREQKIQDGATGVVQFNDVGDRLDPVYKIINIQHNKQQVVVGLYGTSKANQLDLRETDILWPGNQTAKPKGIRISTHLEVVTKAEIPFLIAMPMRDMEGGPAACDSKLKKIPCPKRNSTAGTVAEFCCYGYAVDLLVKIANKVNFTFNLHLVEDDCYGSYERRNGSNKMEWNGMIGELINRKADLIVGPLTIDPTRAEHIDFSKPFKYQGLTILVKKTTKDSSLASFLQPFQDTLWILVGLSVHVVALVLYLLDRFSPFGRFKLAKSDDTEEDALNLSSAMWFAWGVLLNSGIGEGTPRSFSARVLGMVWAGFAMIIVASYTANLAAFLVLDRPEASISGIDDARLRNPQEKFRYATVKNSAVAMYFKRQVELSTMYRTMESRNYDNPEDAIEHVRQEELQAFIWDSARLQYEAANDCNLLTAGELFGRSGYAIGLPKGSPWTHEVNLAILDFHESGQMEELDGKWIMVTDNKCPEKDTSPATLGLTNMAGVFMMVAGGIVAGVFIIFIEIAYKRHRGLKEKELELAKTAADRWRGNIEKRRTLRRTLLQQQEERQKTNGTTGSPGRSPPLPGYTAPPVGYQLVATSAAKSRPAGAYGTDLDIAT